MAIRPEQLTPLHLEDPGSLRTVIQTFDDGPSTTLTPRLLDVLAKNDLTCVFFVIGKHVKVPGARQIVERAFKEGHRIGSHTYSHSDMTRLTADQARDEILRTEQLIGEFLTPNKLFRPPFGACNLMVQDVVGELGYSLTLWNADPEDWRPANQPTRWIDLAIEKIRLQFRSTLVCHDTHFSTVANYQVLIDRVRSIAGARFVSLGTPVFRP